MPAGWRQSSVGSSTPAAELPAVVATKGLTVQILGLGDLLVQKYKYGHLNYPDGVRGRETTKRIWRHVPSQSLASRYGQRTGRATPRRVRTIYYRTDQPDIDMYLKQSMTVPATADAGDDERGVCV
jgi:hypothetical protein